MQTHTQNFTPKPKIPTVDEIGSIENSARNFQQLIAEMTRAGRQSVIAGDGPKMANLAIDAKRARYLMSCNWEQNRKINLARVKYYRDEMRGNRWRITGQDNVVLTTQDFHHPLLMNGQHRLSALIEAAGDSQQNFSLPFSFSFGIDIEGYRVMDCAFSRSAADAINGETIYAKTAAATIKRALEYLDGKLPDGRGGKISSELIYEKFCDWQFEIEAAIEACRRFSNRSGDPLLLHQSTATALHLITGLTSSYRHDRAAIDQFFAKLHSGYEISGARDPIGKARKVLTRFSDAEPSARRAAVAIRAWNATHGGLKNRIGSWRADDPREPFPKIL